METYLAWAFIIFIASFVCYGAGFDGGFDKSGVFVRIVRGATRMVFVVFSFIGFVSVIYLFVLSLKIVTGG